MKFIKKYYIQTSVVFLLFCGAIGTIVESYGIFMMIKTQSVALKQTQMDRELASEYLQNILTFKKDAQYIHDNESILTVLLPDNDDEKVQLFAILEQLAADTGNKNVTLSVSKTDAKVEAKAVEKNEKKVKIQPQSEKYILMTMSLTGNYSDLIAFVQKIENMDYISDVLSIKIVKTTDTLPIQNNANIDEDVPEIEMRKDLIKSEIVVAFYLQEVSK